jgi:hypothetical protein
MLAWATAGIAAACSWHVVGTTGAVGEAFALMEKAYLFGWIACEAFESM